MGTYSTNTKAEQGRIDGVPGSNLPNESFPLITTKKCIKYAHDQFFVSTPIIVAIRSIKKILNLHSL